MTKAERVIRLILRHAWRRGVVGGSAPWTAAGGMAVVAYLARRALAREEEVVFREKLAPGQAIRVVHEARS